MKLFALLLLIVSSSSAFAQLSSSQQLSIVEGIVKNDRRDLWRSGHQEVSSAVSKPSKSKIDEHIRNNGQMETPLRGEEVSSIYSCFHRPQSCMVYIIDIGGEMYGDAGSSRRWVLLNTMTGVHRSFLHTVYVE